MSSRSRTPRWWSKRPPRRNPWPDRCASSTTCSPTTTLAPRIMPPRSWSARPRRPRRPMSGTLPSPRQAMRGRKPAAPPARAPNGSRFRGISMQLLNRLKLWQKLALLVAALAVPTALLGAFYLSAANGEVTQARNELGGAGYAHQVGAVLAQVANHRSLLFAALIQIATRDVPGALIAAGNVQWYATRASIKGYLGGDDQMALHLYHDEVITDFGAAARDLNGA